MSKLDQWLRKKLEDRTRKDLFRVLPAPGNLLDFTSNDYLGLAANKELAAEIRKSVERHEHLNGSTGSRLLSGNSLAMINTEQQLARVFRSDAALLFNSGYSANLAVLSSIPQKGDTIIYDELAHASIKDGARLSLGTKYSFKHNDLADLERMFGQSGDQLPGQIIQIQIAEAGPLRRPHETLAILQVFLGRPERFRREPRPGSASQVAGPEGPVSRRAAAHDRPAAVEQGGRGGGAVRCHSFARPPFIAARAG